MDLPRIATHDVFATIDRQIDTLRSQVSALTVLREEFEEKFRPPNRDDLKADAELESANQLPPPIPIRKPAAARSHGRTSFAIHAKAIAAILADGPQIAVRAYEAAGIPEGTFYKLMKRYGDEHPLGAHFRKSDNGWSLTKVGIDQLLPKS